MIEETQKKTKKENPWLFQKSISNCGTKVMFNYSHANYINKTLIIL